MNGHRMRFGKKSETALEKDPRETGREKATVSRCGLLRPDGLTASPGAYRRAAEATRFEPQTAVFSIEAE